MCAAFLPNRLDAYSNASLTGLGRWWPSATDGPASRGEEMMRPRRHGEGDMVSNGAHGLKGVDKPRERPMNDFMKAGTWHGQKSSRWCAGPNPVGRKRWWLRASQP
jgi:hypothetical protein